MKVFISCPKVDQVVRPSDGSAKTTCSRCQSEVWIALNQQQLKLQQNLQVICYDCAAELGGQIQHLGGSSHTYPANN